MINTVFDLQIDSVKTSEGSVAEDVKSLRESLFKAQEAIAVLSKIIIELNRPAIEAELELKKDQTITSINLTKWSETL